MLAKLPILATVATAYSAIVGNRGAVFQAAFLPLLGLIVLGSIKDMGQDSLLISIVSLLIGAPLGALIAVACHRIVLLGQGTVVNSWSLYWSERETSFVVWILIFGTVIYVAAMLLGVIFLMSPERIFGFRTPWLGTLLTFVCIAYVLGRFSMVFPATAIDKRMAMSNSWYLTDGNGWRVAIALALPFVIATLLIWIIKSLVPTAYGPIFSVLTLAVLLFTAVVEIAVLSFTYKYLTDSASIVDYV